MTLILRLTGMVAAGFAGWHLGRLLEGASPGSGVPGETLRYVLLLALAAAGLGLLLTPYATVVPLRRLKRAAQTAAAADLIGCAVGLLVGLLVAALAAFPLSQLPAPLGAWLPALFAVLCSWLGAAIGIVRKDELFRAVRQEWLAARGGGRGPTGSILLDTSAIVDGRIVEVRLCGFAGGELVVPRFVLEELQLLADSADSQRRQRGRRGLDMLERLQQSVPLEVLDADFSDLRGVDSKLVRLARRERAAIATADYTLNRVASLQGVPVLNVNDLASALRPVVVLGDELAVEIVQEGRERGQGVGYLEDGTMVVVEGGRDLIGQRQQVEATRVLPTAGGRIVFARPKQYEAEGIDSTRASGDRVRWRVIRGAGDGDRTGTRALGEGEGVGEGEVGEPGRGARRASPEVASE